MLLKAVGLVALLGPACAADAGAHLDATCLFQQRAEVGGAEVSLVAPMAPLGDKQPPSVATVSHRAPAAAVALMAMNETGTAAHQASERKRQLAGQALSVLTTGSKLVVHTHDEKMEWPRKRNHTSGRDNGDLNKSVSETVAWGEFPGWADGDDAERGITREDLDLTPYTMWNSAVFPQVAQKSDGDEGLGFFKAAPVGAWMFLLGVCIALGVLDYFVMSRFPSTFNWHLAAIGIWFLAAVGFNLVVLIIEGQQQAFQWASGYLLEWMLSMDNLFVFHLVFAAYQTPSDQIHKAAFVGILGAVVMRGVFFMVVSTLLSLFGWFRYPFGALLIWSGIEAARADDDEDMDPKESRLVKGLTWMLGSRLQDTYDKAGRMVVKHRDSGHYQVTLLVVVIACLEFTDTVFALDSVSAKVAQIPDQYLAFSSSVLAMFGLRAMFFIIKDLVDMFDLLKYGLCVILVFIGLNLMLGEFVHLHPSAIFCMIFAVFLICIVASTAKKAIPDQAVEEGVGKTAEADEEAVGKATATQAVDAVAAA